MNKHTPEPWVAVRNTAYWEIGTEIGGYYAARIGDVCATDPNHPDAGKQEANAARIVACVNACKGINPEAVPDLLAACEAALSFGEGHPDRTPSWHDARLVTQLTLRAAIAKAKGGAA